MEQFLLLMEYCIDFNSDFVSRNTCSIKITKKHHINTKLTCLKMVRGQIFKQLCLGKWCEKVAQDTLLCLESNDVLDLLK